MQQRLAQTLDPAHLQSWRDLFPDDERPSRMRELLDVLLSESATTLAALHVALAAGDTKTCRHLVHRIIGSYCMVGALHIIHLCREMEALLEVGSPALWELAQQLMRIDEEYRRVTQALEQHRP